MDPLPLTDPLTLALPLALAEREPLTLALLASPGRRSVGEEGFSVLRVLSDFTVGERFEVLGVGVVALVVRLAGEGLEGALLVGWV